MALAALGFAYNVPAIRNASLHTTGSLAFITQDAINKTLLDHDGRLPDFYWDGDTDLALGHALCLNDGRGVFTDATAARWPANWGDTRAFLEAATEVKNIWVPYGE